MEKQDERAEFREAIGQKKFRAHRRKQRKEASSALHSPRESRITGNDSRLAAAFHAAAAMRDAQPNTAASRPIGRQSIAIA
jgi:hypothetical protein